MHKRPTVLVWGDVTLGHALCGATLGIHDLDGRCLHEQRRATGTRGAFALRVPAALAGVRGLRLVATGGRLRGRPFTGCVVRQVDRLGAPAYHRLNGLTTLLAALRARHPALPPARAVALLRRMLGWPSGVDFTRALDLPQCHEAFFDPAAWLDEARRTRDFGVFLDRLVADAVAGRAHPVQPALPLLKDWGALAEWAVTGFAGGMLSWAGGQFIGGLFSLMGVGNSTDEKLDQISGKLDELGRRLDATQRAVHELERLQAQTLQKVDALTTLLVREAGAIQENQRWVGELSLLKSRIATKEAALRAPLGTITAAFDQLQRYARLEPQTIDDDMRRDARRRAEAVLALDTGIEACLKQVHDTVVGQIGESYLQDLATLMAQAVAGPEQVRAFADALEQRVDYLLSIQLVGVAMVFDAFLATHPHNGPVARLFRDTWTERLGQQLGLYLRSLEAVAAARIDGPTAAEFNALHGAAADPQQTLLARADAFAAKVSAVLRAATAAPDRCSVTLRLVNHPAATRARLDAATALRLRDEASGTVHAAADLQCHDGATAGDRHLGSVPFQVQVQVFSVPAGRYRIVAPDAGAAGLLRARDAELVAQVDTLRPQATLGVTAWVDSVLPAPCHDLPLVLPDGSAATADALAVQPGRWLHALDWRDARILSVALDGPAARTWGHRGTTEAEFDDIHGLAVAADGSLWIADARPRRVVHWDPHAGRVLGRLDTRSRPLEGPVALAVGPQGWVAVIDNGRRLALYCPERGFLAETSGQDAAHGAFSNATGLAVDATGAVYVAQPQDRRVGKFTLVERAGGQALAPVAGWGLAGAVPNWPLALAVDQAEGWLYVSSQRSHQILKFDLDGHHLATFGEAAVCKQPGAIAVDQQTGRLFVAHGGGQRLTMFAVVRVSLDW